MWIDLITASGDRSLRTLPFDPRRHERLDHGDQPVRGQLVDGPRARRQGGDRAGIVEIDAAQHLSAVHPRRGGGCGGGRRHPVVELELRACQAAAVHRREHDLVLEGAEQQQVVEDVGGGEHAVDAGVGERGAQPVEQVGAAVHRGRPRADAEGAAGGVVGGDDHQPAVATHGRPGGAGLPRPLDRAAGRWRAVR